jgi:DNA helicase-2/ATP-dependent DNA helicase PcrA
MSTFDKEDYLSNLNSAQLEAVTSSSPNLLVLAGAGSGKTRVLTTRIVYLINVMGLASYNILALTFTNKAAKEMRERTLALNSTTSASELRTFHSFGAALLRRGAEHFSLNRNFSIYDDKESIALLKQLYPNENKNKLTLYYRLIEKVKNNALSLNDDWDSYAIHLDKEIFSNYQRLLMQNNAVDFGDLIYKPYITLQNNNELLTKLHNRYKAILVDEYQDTNLCQAALLRLLVSPKCMVTAVGDDDQSIYGFRGAQPNNLFDFKENFSPCHLVKLEQNYRSTSSILACANNLIAHNKNRLGKNLFTKQNSDIIPQVVQLANIEEEATFCAKQLLADANFGNSAVLYRTNAQSRMFEQVFLRLKVPYQLVGSIRFYEREEIKGAMALLTLLVNPNDELAFRRIIALVGEGLGPKSLNTLLSLRTKHKGNLLLASHSALSVLKGKAQSYLAGFISLMAELTKQLESESLSYILQLALNKSGINEHYTKLDEVEESSRVANLNELVNALQPYGKGEEALMQFIENVSLNASAEKENEADTSPKVSLITIHNTKGLEYERVFITGMEDNLFPKVDIYSGNYEAELEEERRLCYVAITRAKYQLYFIYCTRRMLFGRTHFIGPSRFLTELGSDTTQSNQVIKPPVNASYALGSYVRHEDYGFGKIVDRQVNEGRLVVKVRFEGGRLAKFLPEFNHLESVPPPEAIF